MTACGLLHNNGKDQIYSPMQLCLSALNDRHGIAGSHHHLGWHHAEAARWLCTQGTTGMQGMNFCSA